MYQGIISENDLDENQISSQSLRSIPINQVCILVIAAFTKMYIDNNDKANNSKSKAALGYIGDWFDKRGLKNNFKRDVSEANERQDFAMETYDKASQMLSKNSPIKNVVSYLGQRKLELVDGKNKNLILPNIYKNLNNLISHEEKALEFFQDFEKVFGEKFLLSAKEVEKDINKKLREINIQAVCNIRELLLVWIIGKSILSLDQAFNAYYRTQNIIDDGKVEKLIAGSIKFLGKTIRSMVTGRISDQEGLLKRIAYDCRSMLKIEMGETVSLWVLGKFVSIIKNEEIKSIRVFGVYEIMNTEKQPTQIATAFKESQVKMPSSAEKALDWANGFAKGSSYQSSKNMNMLDEEYERKIKDDEYDETSNSHKIINKKEINLSKSSDLGITLMKKSNSNDLDNKSTSKQNNNEHITTEINKTMQIAEIK